jgi:hypothetical protein
MPLLTLDVGGPDEMAVRVTSAGHAEPREVGTRVYTFFGRERSLIQQELFVLALVLYNATPTDVRIIRAMFARAAQVVCSGDVFNNAVAEVTCSGEITDEMEVGTVDGYWITTLTLTEVGDQ